MFKLPELPYSYDSLNPYMSAETLEYHHDKHHQAYVTFVNNYITQHPEFANLTLDEIVMKAYKDPNLTALYNNAAQVINHNELWYTLKLNENPKIPSELEKKLIEDFGSVEQFKQQFIQSGVTLFGSGWAWLTLENGKLVIKKYSNGGTPVQNGLSPILCCDVWEHSYYIDYRNVRLKYVEAYVNNLINWEYVTQCYLKATTNQN